MELNLCKSFETEGEKERMRVDGFTWLVRGLGSSQIECLMVAYTMKHSAHANQRRRGISHHPEYDVTAFSWGRTREEGKKK